MNNIELAIEGMKSRDYSKVDDSVRYLFEELVNDDSQFSEDQLKTLKNNLKYRDFYVDDFDKLCKTLECIIKHNMLNMEFSIDIDIPKTSDKDKDRLSKIVEELMDKSDYCPSYVLNFLNSLNKETFFNVIKATDLDSDKIAQVINALSIKNSEKTNMEILKIASDFGYRFQGEAIYVILKRKIPNILEKQKIDIGIIQGIDHFLQSTEKVDLSIAISLVNYLSTSLMKQDNASYIIKITELFSTLMDNNKDLEEYFNLTQNISNF